MTIKEIHPRYLITFIKVANLSKTHSRVLWIHEIFQFQGSLKEAD